MMMQYMCPFGSNVPFKVLQTCHRGDHQPKPVASTHRSLVVYTRNSPLAEAGSRQQQDTISTCQASSHVQHWQLMSPPDSLSPQKAITEDIYVRLGRCRLPTTFTTMCLIFHFVTFPITEIISLKCVIKNHFPHLYFFYVTFAREVATLFTDCPRSKLLEM